MRLLPLICVCAGLSLYSASVGSQSKSPDPLPSLADLQKLKFTSSPTTPLSKEPDHAELLDAIQSFQLFGDKAGQVQG